MHGGSVGCEITGRRTLVGCEITGKRTLGKGGGGGGGGANEGGRIHDTNSWKNREGADKRGGRSDGTLRYIVQRNPHSAALL